MRQTLGQFEGYDWGVWFNDTHLIATYDGSCTVWDRRTGGCLATAVTLDKAKAITGLPEVTHGEAYMTGY